MQLIELWQSNQTPATATFVASRFEQLEQQYHFESCRVAILRSFTLESVIPLLRAAAFVNGLSLEVRVGDFNAYPQEVLSPDSWLYSFAPKVVILAVQMSDIAPELMTRFWSLTETQRASVAERAITEINRYIDCLRSRTAASIVVHSFEEPIYPSLGILAGRNGMSCWATQQGVIGWMNTRLRGIAARYTGVYILDYDSVIAEVGRRNWHDLRRWAALRVPFRPEGMSALSVEWLRYLQPLSGRVAKVLVTDLDNTLWGGILGEDGLEHIQIGHDYPGFAYLELQAAMLDLYHRGILLAISSKNNKDEAVHALAHHPNALLRPHYFAAMRINWTDKATHLKELANELSLGLDSFVFLDDNPVERQSIRLQLPEVTVLDLPQDPTGYARVLRSCPLFERLTLSDEDLHRTEYYRSQNLRDETRSKAASVEEYYHLLAQEVTIAKATPDSIARVSQLTQKTNQFNLTTRRYSEAEIRSLMDSPDWDIYTVRVKDRFGDNGLVGVCICHTERTSCMVDTLLLSCRVIGRTVETALLTFIAGQKSVKGLETLEGWFIPTKKNAPASDFYKKHGFALVGECDGATLWRTQLGKTAFTCPEWIRLIDQTAEVE